ncbi:MAG: acyl-CoA desaturase [Pseudomonadota bacterium]
MTSIYLESRGLSSRQWLAAFLTIAIPPLVLLYVLSHFGYFTSYFATDIILFIVFYTISTLGISSGYHRFFAHKSFKANRAVKILLALMGSIAAQGPVLFWASTHRRHHAYSDKSGDVHSPNLHRNKFAGLVHAHVGWMFTSKLSNPLRFSKDLLRDRDLNNINNYYWYIVAAGMLIPGLIALLLHHTSQAFLEGIVWGGMIRTFVAHHVTWSLNSFAHVYGRKDFETGEGSHNLPLLSVISMGESWHNSHHAFPTSARFGLGKWQPDLGYIFIRFLHFIGTATEVRLPESSAIERKKTEHVS